MPRVRRLASVFGCLAALFGLIGVAGGWWYHASRPESRLRRGQEALQRGDDAKAEQLAEQLEADGHADHAALLRGAVFFHQRSYSRARTEFQKVRAQGEMELQARVYAGQCLVYLKELSAAARILRSVLAEQPDQVEAHRGLAAIYYDQGAMEWAIHHCEEWARLAPHDGRPFRFLGLIYKDRPIANDRAIASYQEALRRELGEDVAEEVREELTECLVRESDYTQALQTLDSCTPEVAEKPALIACRAESLWGLGQTIQAQALLDEALRAHPGSVDLLRLRGKLHLEAREHQAAATVLERAVAIDRHDYVSRHHLALAHESLGRHAEAEEQRRLMAQTQEYLKTLTKLNEEVTRKPWDAALHRRLAEVCEQLEKRELAAMWLRAAAACPPTKK